MCGLIHVRSLDGKRASKRAWKRYLEQRTRGSDGFGYIAIQDGKVVAYERMQYEEELHKMLKKETAEEILLHHRLPTSTANIPEANHPIYISSKQFQYAYYIMHNGVISNADELYEKHKEQGFKYRTVLNHYIKTQNNRIYKGLTEFNDSEALAYELIQAIENEKEIETKGSVAFIILAVKKRGGKVVALHYGHNDRNPLKIEDRKELLSIRSEGGDKEVTTDTLFTLDYETNTFAQRDMQIGNIYKWNHIEYNKDAKKLGFPTEYEKPAEVEDDILTAEKEMLEEKAIALNLEIDFALDRNMTEQYEKALKELEDVEKRLLEIEYEEYQFVY